MLIWNCMLLLLTKAVSAQVQSGPLRECHPEYEYSCVDGHCVSTLVWCDGAVDCPDGSDEDDCQGAYEAKPAVQISSPELAVAKAVEYFMKKKDADNGWDSFTPRAIVAMSFASRVSPVEGKELMKKQLNIRLLLDLMQSQNRLSLSNLALYINALYATCQDPQNFQGIDLVTRLRLDADAALLSNSSIPLAYLTLCMARQTKQYDAHTLATMYNMEEFQRPGSRALIVMAMICYARTEMSVSFRYRIKDFLVDRKPAMLDVYSKALFMQTSIANGIPVPIEELTKEQLPNGSFGDMLATYYAIPVLTGSSLLDLKCNGTTDTGMENALKGSGANDVIFSLWISIGSEANTHAKIISFDGNKTFFEIMLIAAARDPLYRFLYDKMGNQKRVYSIAGIPNDSESGKSWMLFRGKINDVRVNSVQNLESLPVDVNIPAKDKDHFVFWFTRDPRS